MYSIVIPVYNEEESLPVLVDEICAAMAPIMADYELIIVDDGSTDASPEILAGLGRRMPASLKIITTKQAGQTHAMRKGIEASKGQWVITMDADLQNDPADIPRMIAKMKEGGLDCVCGWRRNRKDSFLKAFMSKGANFIQRLLTGCPVHDISCTLRIYTKACALAVPLNWKGQHRFIALCAAMQGYKIGEIETNHRPRRFGRSKYSHKRVFRVVTDFFKILSTRGRR